MQNNEEQIIMKVTNLRKTFPGVVALNNIDLIINRNSVCCIVGENGAGKSSFIKIVTGAYRKDSGEIIFNNSDYNPHHVKDSIEAGISTIYQELNVIEQLTVEENLVLGLEKSHFGVILESDAKDKMVELLHELDPSIQLDILVSKLSVAQKQTIEIAKALSVDAILIIMDEPTASLSEDEVLKLFEMIRKLKEKGITIIYITHRLDEIPKIGDDLIVFRDGNVVCQKPLSEIKTSGEIPKLMVGDIEESEYLGREIDYSKPVLEVKNVTSSKLKDISFTVYEGEVLGFFGLIGAGKSEIARAIYGADPFHEGSINKLDSVITKRNPKNVLNSGISLVPEERRTEGIFQRLDIRQNVSITNLDKVLRLGIISNTKEKQNVVSYMKSMSVKATSERQKAGTLSGGNQQKVVISKCLNADADILLFDEPTRGIDVGAKEEIYELIRGLANRGVSIIIFSSEIKDILSLCDRIILLYDGKIVKTLQHHEVDVDEVMHIITGG